MTQPTDEQMKLARQREFLLGQVSVDIEIALNKVGVLLTEEQGYIAAEAAIQATEARIAARERERWITVLSNAEKQFPGNDEYNEGWHNCVEFIVRALDDHAIRNPS